MTSGAFQKKSLESEDNSGVFEAYFLHTARNATEDDRQPKFFLSTKSEMHQKRGAHTHRVTLERHPVAKAQPVRRSLCRSSQSFASVKPSQKVIVDEIGPEEIEDDTLGESGSAGSAATVGNRPWLEYLASREASIEEQRGRIDRDRELQIAKAALDFFYSSHEGRITPTNRAPVTSGAQLRNQKAKVFVFPDVELPNQQAKGAVKVQTGKIRTNRNSQADCREQSAEKGDEEGAEKVSFGHFLLRESLQTVHAQMDFLRTLMLGGKDKACFRCSAKRDI